MGAALQGNRDNVILMTKFARMGAKESRHADAGRIPAASADGPSGRVADPRSDLRDDPDLIFAPDGAIEALVQAKKQGKVRFVGFTGHKDPAIHLKMLAHDFHSIRYRCR